MGRKGSQKNERKANEDKVRQARDREDRARRGLQALKSQPIFERRGSYAELLKAQTGILKKAIEQRKKSETHSRLGKQKGGSR